MTSHDIRSSVDTSRVRQLVESGEYFSQARIWYHELYHRPLGERSFFVVMTLFSAITIFLSTVVYTSMFPLAPTVPYIISTERSVEDMPFITPLRLVPGEDLNNVLVRFLLQNYIAARERYKYDVVDIERRSVRVQSATAAAELQKYLEENNPQNPSSPYNRYGRGAERQITIQSVSSNLEVEPRQARVYFSATVIQGQEVKTSQWLATIAFHFPLVTVDPKTSNVLQWNEKMQTFEPMQNIVFEVTAYATQEVSNGAK
jgi:type IV secretion system protein VirB8